MKTVIPGITETLASTLPGVIAKSLYQGYNGRPIFIHINFSEDIDFYSGSPHWEVLELEIKEGAIKDEARNPLTIKTIVPYLEAYSLGFSEGFNSLEQQINSGLFASDEIKARKIIELANSFSSGGFPERAGDGKPGRYITKDLWREAGIKSGLHYKAWYIIANNYEPFLKYFEEPKPDGKPQTGDEPFRNSVMNDRAEINKYSFWVQEIDRYPEYLDSINPSAYELKKRLDYIQQWKSREFVEINNLLLLNPTMTLEEAKSEGFKQLERVAMLINKRVSKTITKEPPPARLQSFSWTGSQAQMEALCEALITAGYIHPDTTNKAFTAIFSGEPIDNSLSRVTWIKKAQKSKQVAKSAVIALFDILANAGKIPKAETTNGAELFRKLQSCFCDEAGKPLKFEHKHTSYSKENTDLLQQIISSL